MKPVEEVTACVCDFGTFIAVAECLADTMATVYYHTPVDQEYQDIRDCVLGTGLEKVKRLDDPLDPDVFDSIDLFVFPDIGFAGLQKHLRSLGKAVFGHMGATDLELYRTMFLDVLKEVGLPTIHSQECVGLTALAEYLKENENKWVKINRFRANMETWHHLNYEHSLRTLESLAVTFGGAKEDVIFLVQDDLESDLEIGYDGWCIDGEFPESSFQGYEKKNELYLGSLLAAEDLPIEIKTVNAAMAGNLADYRYRCWWATEIRVKDGVPYFIDPTPRLPGQTGEHQLQSCSNMPDVIWQGANGILIKPLWEWDFAAEATLHYERSTKDIAVVEEWKTLHLPEEALPWLKLYRFCKKDGIYHFCGKGTDEVGIVMGRGDSVEESIEHLKENLELLKGLPVHANIAGFASLLESIKEAEDDGLKFGGRIPKPEEIFKDSFEV